MRWLYQEVAEPPYVPVPPSVVSHVECQPLAKPVYQPPRWHASQQFCRTWLPSTYTIFSAFELSSFDAVGSMNEMAAMPVQATQGHKPNRRVKDSQGNKGKGQQKPKRFGDSGWILGMRNPPPMESSPWGEDGTAPLEETLYSVESMVSPRPEAAWLRTALHQNERAAPWYFGPARQRIDWETPLSLEFRRSRITPSNGQVFVDLAWEEQITLDKWYVPFSQWLWEKPWRVPGIESFTNLVTDELVTLDKYDTPLVRPLPWRPKMPVGAMPFEERGEEPLDEEITLDKWYQRLSEPVRLPVWTYLIRSPHYQIFIPNDETENYPLYGWRSPARVPVWPRPHLVPEMGVSPGNTERLEEISVDKYDNPLTWLLPWRPKMPVALFPFRKEREESLDEQITLDKWYNLLSLPQPPLSMQAAYQVFEDEVYEETAEQITLDKWYSPLSIPVLPLPVLQLLLGVLPEEPIPDIPGVTYSYWLTALQQPLNQPLRLPILYQPLQRLYDKPYLREVPWPRRRPDRRFTRRRP